MKDEEKILLYWSGEADESLCREVENLLELDSEARAYFSELGHWQSAMEEEVPPKRDGLLDEVMQSEEPIARKAAPFPKGTVVAVAAMMAVLGVVIFLLIEDDSPIAGSPPVEPERAEDRPRLSERLFERSSISFRDSEEFGLRRTKEKSERWQILKRHRENI